MDVLRGLALLGILLMNLEGFAGPPALMGTGIDPQLRGLDRWADAAIYVLVQGKFIALFSLLFGAGFAVMAGRAEREGWSLRAVWGRRCAGLLLIGLLHALLVWSGDILVTYALCGLLLLGFGEVLGRILAWIGVGIFLVPAGVSLLAGLGASALAASPGWQQALQAQAAQAAATAQAQIQAYGHGDFMAATSQRLLDLGDRLAMLPMTGAQVFGLFLVGAWLGPVLTRPAAHARALAWMRLGALPVGLALMLGSVAVAPWIDPARADLRICLAASMAAAASLPLCLGYVSWTMRWLASSHGDGIASWLAAAGRLALSNYLLQSLVCTWVFYASGLGAFGLGRSWQVMVGFALFGVQLLLSACWQRAGRLGPAEWLLRTLTYARLPARRGAV